MKIEIGRERGGKIMVKKMPESKGRRWKQEGWKLEMKM